MARKNAKITGICSGILVAAAATTTQAASVEDFHLNFDVGHAIDGNFDGYGRDKGFYSDTGGGSVSAEATAWANTYNNPTSPVAGDIPGSSTWSNEGGSGTEYASSFRTALVRFSGNGIGVRIDPPSGGDAGLGDNVTETGSSGQHALDNIGVHEFILFEFNQAVTIKEAAIGWPSGTGSLDTDFTLLAYTGNNIAAGAAGEIQDGFGGSDTDIASDMSLFNSNDGDGSGTVGFTQGGWEMFNVFDMQRDQFTDIGNTNNVASTYWLVGAQNQHLLDSNHVHRDHYADFGKLLGLKGHVPSHGGGGGGGNAPEPGTLALLGIGMLGFMRRRRS